MSHAHDLPILNFTLDTTHSIRFSYAHPNDNWLRRTAIKSIERLTGQPKLARHYRSWTRDRRKGENIFEAGLRLLNIGLLADQQKCTGIPRKGPLLVVANHPFGVADGLAIGALLTRSRPDVKLMCHSLLCQPLEAARYLLPVDFGNTSEARKRSAATRQDAIAWLEQGHCLIVFPGGAVATRQEPRNGPSLEHPWHPFTGRLAAVPGTQIMPVFFHGENSTLFHLASHTNYALRVALLFRETLRLVGKTVIAEIGELVDGGDLTAGVSRAETTRQLHELTMGLETNSDAKRLAHFRWPSRMTAN